VRRIFHPMLYRMDYRRYVYASDNNISVFSSILFEHKPKLHGDIVVALVVLGAANAIVAPLAVLYILCA
jgi:hypothetical protein